jgi:uncharacterized protein YbjT (DUF2867 family)
MILVTGATGNVGSELIRELVKDKRPVRAFVRNSGCAQAIALTGVQLVVGDFEKPDTFGPALDGVEQLFLLIPSSAYVEKQQCQFVDAAKRSRVKRIVKLSQFAANEYTRGRFQRYHGGVEHYIRNAKIAYTFLRPNLFMQGLLNFQGTIVGQGAFYLPAADSRVSVVDVRDVAAVAARLLVDSRHNGKTYSITGPAAITHAEMAEALSRATGRTIKFVDISPEAMREKLLELGMERWRADGLLEDYDHYRRGEAAEVSSAVRDLTGKEARSFEEFARDYAERFVGKAAGA